MQKIASISTSGSVAWGGCELLRSRSAQHLAQLGDRWGINVYNWPPNSPPIPLEIWERERRKCYPGITSHPTARRGG
ncbi:hypothetical protein [Oxynema aestuarii]|jgi:hypothetical protein|uniref:Uncharacterized protein n=1 Tax=Oxynema aestuarii AP17 TaxID=2064643 RepID=A0A6H1TT92_9CYAN|nr:hypothetical protein [Oxynema aestuarii]QIZ69180.1 hypothetical protein HCG48_00075 [Oxynema aestuarii AP17]RMH77363.1 MAG: hypothetical protein D6680_05595 [Cyanobacteria bacterium J007]